MSARELITEHLDLWTGAVTKKSTSGRGSNGKVELTGVKKLRELILELAVRGMLVEQAPNEAPASMLLDEVMEERRRLTNEGQIRGQKCLPATELDRLPAKLPSGWAGATLSHLGVFSGGKTPSKSRSEFWNGDIPWVTPKDMKSAEIATSEDHVTQDALNAGGLALLPENAVLFVVRSGILRRMFPTAVTRVQCTINQDLKALQLFKPEMARYIQVLSWGFERFILEKLTKTGTTVESLKFGDFANQPFPLPPLEEQHRIVQKVDELMTLCDRLEQQTSDQLEAHETLVDTLLGTLTQSENATELADNWARLAAHFDTLFTTEQSIDKLKQTILQLAVMGRLVEQDAADEPVSELLDRIKKEKANLVRSGKLKSQKALASVSDEEKPYSLPENWIWARLGSYAADIHYGYTASASATLTEHRLLRITDIQNNKVNWTTVPGCEITEQQAMPYLLYNNDILIARTGGTIGKSYLVENIDVKAVFASYLIRVRKLESTNAKYLKIFLGSQTYWDQLYEAAMGTGQPNVNGKSLKNLALPIPPLQEQHRVVSKVDELMALCDHLKQRLNQASETRNQLADAVVEGALG